MADDMGGAPAEGTAVDTAVDTGAAPQDAGTQPAATAGASQPAQAEGQQAQPQQEPAAADWSFDAETFKDREMSPAFIDGYSAIAKELGMTKENAEAMLTKAADLMGRLDVEAVERQNAEWIAAVKNDKEFGGSALNANLAIAKKGLDAFGSDALKDILESTGLGNNPEVIRFFWKVGQAVSEDTFAQRSTGTRPASDDERFKAMYPEMFAQIAQQG